MARRISLVLWLTLVSHAGAVDEPKARPVENPELRSDLLRLAKADQDARGAVDKWMERFGKGDITDEAAFEASLDAVPDR